MTRPETPGHPDLESLLAHAEDRSGSADREAVGRHLETCALCRLEIKRFQRFGDLGEDPEVDREAQWDRAEKELDRIWEQDIRTRVVADKGARVIAMPRRAGPLWLVPAAMAAVLAVVLLWPATSPEVGESTGRDDRGIFRGAEQGDRPGIVLDSPSGDLNAPPDSLFWTTEEECDSYSLEILTSDLRLVFSRDRIEQPMWTVEAELIALLDPDTIYVWSVRGHRQHQVVAESGSAWFRFP